MKEVKKCSISGVAFTMDADAYVALSSYLESLKITYKDTPDGVEIAADIEARIAELILSAQDNARVVEKPLIDNIIAQMGSVEDISEEEIGARTSGEPRIPRRLYRDTENAKLGGVCAGIGKYFDMDPVWVRLAMFVPLLMVGFAWIPGLGWTEMMMGNLFAIFVTCYLIMWFAVPVARTARQKLEMTGERITAQSIRENTATNGDVDRKAKPIIADVVLVFGQVVLILLKIVAGVIVFGLIVAACALVIGLFAVIVTGSQMFDSWMPAVFIGNNMWIHVLGIFIALIPVILLIYVLMCLIASRRPSGRSVLIIFLLWFASIIACSCIAIRQGVAQPWLNNGHMINNVMEREAIIDSDPTIVDKSLVEVQDVEIGDVDSKTLRISVPTKTIDITVDKESASLKVSDSQ